MPTVTPDNGSTQIAVTPNSFTLTFTVTPTVPPSGISWFLGPNEITNDLGLFRQLSADRLNLTISIVTSSDEGIFRLVATNSFGNGEASVSVSVQSMLHYIHITRYHSPISIGLCALYLPIKSQIAMHVANKCSRLLVIILVHALVIFYVYSIITVMMNSLV